MNLVSFVDELVKVGAMRCLYKQADDGEVNTADVPHGMMSHDPMPASIRVDPASAATRLPNSARSPVAVLSGLLGPIALSRNPIDREKFNRSFQERR